MIGQGLQGSQVLPIVSADSVTLDGKDADDLRLVANGYDQNGGRGPADVPEGHGSRFEQMLKEFKEGTDTVRAKLAEAQAAMAGR